MKIICLQRDLVGNGIKTMIMDYNTTFPVRLIYEKVMPQICNELSSAITYWTSSPYGGLTANDTSAGDSHVRTV